ncbi:hypothetical protein D9M71_519250 [compost metagenome]
MGDEGPAESALAGGDHLDQGYGQEHRHRVVAARFDLQGGADPLVEAASAEQAEHRRGVGGTDDGADQQAFQGAEAEQPGSGNAGQPGGDQYADGGQGQRGPECHAEGGRTGSHAAIEEDDGQRQVAHQVGLGIVVEGDTAGAVAAGEHSDHQEHDEDGDAEARPEGADQDAHAYQHRADQEQAIDGGGIHWWLLANGGMDYGMQGAHADEF